MLDAAMTGNHTKNMEYYFQSSLGLVALIPCQGLPSAVELRVAGKTLGRYLSAEEAARAVASSLTGHAELDALPCAKVPMMLCDWKQSLLHQFTAEALRPETAEEPALEQRFSGYPETEFAL
jgi:hypothetical protein